MIIEIMDVTPETKVSLRMSLLQWISMTIGAIGIGGSMFMYFGYMPAQGNTVNTLSPEYASKEYVSTNYVSKDKLTDSLLNLQTQINNLIAINNMNIKTIDERQTRIENLLLELVKKR